MIFYMYAPWLNISPAGQIFEQVSDEVIEQYHITQGDFDMITGCKYRIPGFQDIGGLYSIMIEDCAEPGEEVSELIKIFTSFISDEISDFQTDVYYQNPSYLECSYRAGVLLEWKLLSRGTMAL